VPRIELEAVEPTNATGYPAPHDTAVAGRWYRRLGPAAALTHLGASHVTLKPGAWSSQRHWHAAEDELLVMLSGEAVLVEDGGETILRAGDIAAWPAGVRDGHHLQNRTDTDCTFIVVSAGDRAADRGEYPDIDLTFDGEGFARKDGTRYPTRRSK